jgi:hypothetical protein
LGIYHGTANPLVSVKVGVGAIKLRLALAVTIIPEIALHFLAVSLQHLRRMGVIPGLLPGRAKGGAKIKRLRIKAI